MKSSNFQNPNESTGLLFWQTSMLWQRKIKEVLQPYNLTHTQFVILAVIEELSEQKMIITQKRISDFSMIDVMTLSSTVRLLEKKELISRVPLKSDPRANALSNTKKGQTILAQAIKEVEKIDISFFFQNPNENSQFHNMLLTLSAKNKDFPGR